MQCLSSVLLSHKKHCLPLPRKQRWNEKERERVRERGRPNWSRVRSVCVWEQMINTRMRTLWFIAWGEGLVWPWHLWTQRAGFVLFSCFVFILSLDSSVSVPSSNHVCQLKPINVSREGGGVRQYFTEPPLSHTDRDAMSDTENTHTHTN